MAVAGSECQSHLASPPHERMLRGTDSADVQGARTAAATAGSARRGWHDRDMSSAVNGACPPCLNGTANGSSVISIGYTSEPCTWAAQELRLALDRLLYVKTKHLCHASCNMHGWYYCIHCSALWTVWLHVMTRSTCQQGRDRTRALVHLVIRHCTETVKHSLHASSCTSFSSRCLGCTQCSGGRGTRAKRAKQQHLLD